VLKKLVQIISQIGITKLKEYYSVAFWSIKPHITKVFYTFSVKENMYNSS